MFYQIECKNVHEAKRIFLRLREFGWRWENGKTDWERRGVKQHREWKPYFLVLNTYDNTIARDKASQQQIFTLWRLMERYIKGDDFLRNLEGYLVTWKLIDDPWEPL